MTQAKPTSTDCERLAEIFEAAATLFELHAHRCHKERLFAPTPDQKAVLDHEEARALEAAKIMRCLAERFAAQV